MPFHKKLKNLISSPGQKFVRKAIVRPLAKTVTKMVAPISSPVQRSVRKKLLKNF